ncbi:hypothetical protein RF11_05105 [Thelohanellus kitauei]|uniref:Secreted protein n=1 Tax=Thelohanellus kitauei TaxID=669202 RepID=A0A0C2IEZ5_THEKT|nr:hypothetical protein RF11_05105 [Thelohanellus kitauei]
MIGRKRSWLCIFMLCILEISFESNPDSGSSTRPLTTDVVDKMIKCLGEKHIKFCNEKPNLGELKTCANSSVEGADKISETVLEQIFTKLIEARGNNLLPTDRIPRYQTYLITKMNQYISERHSLHLLSQLKMKELIRGISRFAEVRENEYFEIYCTFKELIDVSSQFMKSVQSIYHELKQLADNHPKTDTEISNVKGITLSATKTLIKSIEESYSSVKFAFRIMFGSFISTLVISSLKEHDKIQDGLHDKIRRIRIETMSFTEPPEYIQAGIVFF